MKILKNNIKLSGLLGAVIYGEDEGLLFSIIKECYGQFAGYEVIKIDANLNANPMDSLVLEYTTPSFFNDKKLISIIGHASKMEGMEGMLEGIENQNCFILVCVVGNLDAKSKIRKFAESAQHIGIIACYKDEEKDVNLLVQNFIRKHNLQVSQAVIRFISSTFADNRSMLNLELEKLMLYANGSEITLQMVEDCFAEIGESNIFDAVNEFFSLNHTKFAKEVDALKLEGLPSFALLSNLSFYCLKLIDIMEEKQNTKKTFDAILAERFIFFKQIPKMKDHLTKWNLETLHSFLQQAIEFEIFIKTNPSSGYNSLLSYHASII